MTAIIKLLIEILRRLKFVPGLGFVDAYYTKLLGTYAKIDKKRKEFIARKDYVADKLRSAREIPALVKGSKKKQKQ